MSPNSVSRVTAASLSIPRRATDNFTTEASDHRSMSMYPWRTACWTAVGNFSESSQLHKVFVQRVLFPGQWRP